VKKIALYRNDWLIISVAPRIVRVGLAGEQHPGQGQVAGVPARPDVDRLPQVDRRQAAPGRTDLALDHGNGGLGLGGAGRA